MLSPARLRVQVVRGELVCLGRFRVCLADRTGLVHARQLLMTLCSNLVLA